MAHQVSDHLDVYLIACSLLSECQTNIAVFTRLWWTQPSNHSTRWIVMSLWGASSSFTTFGWVVNRLEFVEWLQKLNVIPVPEQFFSKLNNSISSDYQTILNTSRSSLGHTKSPDTRFVSWFCELHFLRMVFWPARCDSAKYFHDRLNFTIISNKTVCYVPVRCLDNLNLCFGEAF